jgi:Protein of unknown function (DUF1569)
MKTLLDDSAQMEITQRLKSVRPNAARKWGKMTSHQMICHLADSFRGTMGEKPVSAATGLFQRTVLKWGGLYVPIPWPHGIPTRPEMDQQAGGTPPAEFEGDVGDFLTLMKRFLSGPKSRHPLFGAMSEWEWARWAYLHMDHHLRQFGS